MERFKLETSNLVIITSPSLQMTNYIKGAGNSSLRSK